MISEGDQDMLRTLIRREGIDQVLMALADVIQSMPPRQLAGETIAFDERNWTEGAMPFTPEEAWQLADMLEGMNKHDNQGTPLRRLTDMMWSAGKEPTEEGNNG